jgi:hypothetical protein
MDFTIYGIGVIIIIIATAYAERRAWKLTSQIVNLEILIIVINQMIIWDWLITPQCIVLMLLFIVLAPCTKRGGEVVSTSCLCIGHSYGLVPWYDLCILFFLIIQLSHQQYKSIYVPVLIFWWYLMCIPTLLWIFKLIAWFIVYLIVTEYWKDYHSKK